MIRAIVIDDEFKAIELLENYINRVPFLALAESFRNPLEAITYLQTNTIDLIFLDINMRELSGISFLKTVQHRPDVILTTAYSEYALESYEYNVLDYLLKPISFERFLKAVTKISPETNTEIVSPTTPKSIFIKDGYKKVKLLVNDILYLKKEGNYIIYYTKDQKVMARQTIQQALDILENDFLQIHKSFIINCQKVDTFQSNTITIGRNTLPVGQSFRLSLKEKMHLQGR